MIIKLHSYFIKGFDSEGNEVVGANERKSTQAEDIVDDSEVSRLTS